MLLQAYLESSAELRPGEIALVAGERRLSYAELEALANRVARGLVELGVRSGDRVAIWLDNSVENVVAIFAALKAGAAFMTINPATKGNRLAFMLDDAGARAVFLPKDKVRSLELEKLRALEILVTVGDGAAASSPTSAKVVAFESLAAEGSQGPLGPRAIDLDLAALIYTSGSTGDPKGVMLTHLNVRTAIESIVSYTELGARDVLMNVLPLSFGYGLTHLFSAMRSGARLVLEKGMAYPHLTLTKIGAESVTGLGMVPTIAAVLLGLDLSKYDLGTLRFVTNAGAALPTAHAEKFRAALPRVRLFCMYGQTECLRISYLEPDDLDARPGSVGRGMPNQEAWLVDDRDEPVGPNAVGELVVRGAHVMRGYWRQPEETRAKLRPGRFEGERVLYTGDLFRRDEEGFLFFVSRKDDIIKCKGEKVSPLEVENVLLRHEGIAEAAVVGSPHPIFGEAVKAVVVLAPGVELTAREVQNHCARELEDYMVPKLVEFRNELPKTTTGKVLKKGL